MNDWQPTYSDEEPEKAITLSCDLIQPYSSSTNDLGVMMNNPPEDYHGEGALFWVDAEHIYFRFSWKTWYIVASDNAELCTALCRRRTASFTIFTNTTTRRHPIRVIRLEALPPELFGADALRVPPTRTFSDDPKSFDQEHLAVGDLAALYEGTHLVSVRHNAFRADLYEITGTLVIITYFPHVGDWVPDGLPFSADREPPFWFGADRSVPSPIVLARQLQDGIRGILPPDQPLLSLVVFKHNCRLTRERELVGIWSDDYLVTPVRLQALPDSAMPTPDLTFDGIDVLPSRDLTPFADALTQLLQDFSSAHADAF